MQLLTLKGEMQQGVTHFFFFQKLALVLTETTDGRKRQYGSRMFCTVLCILKIVIFYL